MNDTLHNICVVLVSWAVIFSLRALPFIAFGKRAADSRFLKATEKWLSPAIILMLVVYSYSGLEWRTLSPYLAGALTVALQLKFQSGLVSIFGGTALYMLLVR
ncbi:MAG: AzlD domain-containing protein [Kiritimatiellae bacterium]|nr:AzlD domain-containing protein [Kiritimatiellia bacterium]